MHKNDTATLARIAALPIRGRVAFLIALAEMVVLELAEDPQGLKVAQEPLRLSWRWVSGEPVKGQELDQYIGGPPEKAFELYQFRYRANERLLGAMIATTRAVGYAGRMAYDAEGATEMSSVMWEIGEDVNDGVLDCPKMTSRYDEASVGAVTEFPANHYAGQPREALGSPLRGEEILPLISGESRNEK